MDAPDLEPRAARQRIDDGPGEIAFLDFGPADRAPDVVFSHANGFNARTYRTILAPLSGLRILALDARGHGATDLPADPAGRRDWSDLARDLGAFLDRLDLRDVVLAGHSMGGTTSLLTAAALPERARALALFDPVLLGDRARSDRTGVTESPLISGAKGRRRRFPSREEAFAAYRGRGAFKTWVDAMLKDYVAAGFRDVADGGVELTCDPAWESSNFLAHENDPMPAFEAFDGPVWVLKAEHNSTIRLGDQEPALRRSGDVRMETVPGTTHFLPMERPDLVRATLLKAVGG